MYLITFIYYNVNYHLCEYTQIQFNTLWKNTKFYLEILNNMYMDLYWH